MIKLIGATAVALACLIATREFILQGRRRRAESEGFLSLLRFIRMQIGSFSAPLASIYGEFHDPALDALGFTDALAEGDLRSALERFRGRMSVGARVSEILDAFASELGGGYREEQIESCDRYIAELGEEVSSVRVESERGARLACSLTVTFALMLIIVLL